MSRPDTRLVHEGEGPREQARPATTPIYQTSTFLFESAAALEAFNAGKGAGYLYSRHANPTVEAAEAKIAALEGADAALVTASGMAATSTALVGLLSAGDELVVSAAVYGGTVKLVTGILARFGVKVRLVPIADDLAAAIGPSTRVVWFESPTNPTLRCVDIARVVEACRAHGATSIIDNTFATPLNQQPLALGVDLVMHSATKYLNGHSDIVAGALAGSATLIERLSEARRILGGVLDPGAAYALARGMKTMGLRVARQNESAMRLARWLEGDPRVRQVLYPGLPSHPDHELASRQMRGYGGMLTVAVRGGYEAACRVFDRFELIGRAASLGGIETLCSMPVLTSHYGVAPEALEAAGVTDDMLRISVGLEDVEDLIADFDRALGT
ncbi:MAG: aminotransferase class I/II-fold pyridoxal phosphate-dependent enzyme [Acidobacteriota bacterium]